MPHAPRASFRTLFISDLHLGTRNTRTEELLDFLDDVGFDQLYLVGDIIDGWALERSRHWPEAHQEVVSWILKVARSGKKVVYIPGNHDEFARRFFGNSIGSLVIQPDAIHQTADGRKYLVTHGDEFDGIIRVAPWVSRLGAGLYGLLLDLNRAVNWARAHAGKEYWSLSAALKLKTKKAVQFVADFRTAVVMRARQEGADGVICGHIHHAESYIHKGVHYVNTGDWVESCSALVERHDGTLELLFPQADDLRRLVLDPTLESEPAPGPSAASGLAPVNGESPAPAGQEG